MRRSFPPYLSLLLAASVGAGLGVLLQRAPARPHQKVPGLTSARSGVQEAVPAESDTVSVNIPELLELARKAPSPESATAALMNGLRGADAQHLARLAAEFPWRLEGAWHEETLSGCILARWAEKDAEGTWKWLAAADSPGRMKRHAFLTSMARRDAEQALRWTRTLLPVSERPYLLSSIAEVVAETDPHRALTLARASGYGGPGYRTYSVFRIWARKDPTAALAAAQQAPSAEERRYVISQIMSVWGQADPAAARAALAGLPDSLRRGAEGRLLRAWAEKDPAAAFTAAGQMKGGARARSMNAVLQLWAQKDPEAALKSVLSQTSVQERRRSLDTVFGHWASADPEGAAAALNLPNLTKTERRSAISSIASNWANLDGAAALKWARSLDSREGGDSAVRSALNTLAYQDGAAAAAAWLQLPEKQRAGSVPSIAGGWAQQDAEAATAWALALPKGQDRRYAISGLLSAVDLTDTTRITSLLEHLPAGAARTDALASLAENRASSDPGGVLTLLAAMPEAERFAFMKQSGSMAHYLIQEDPKAFGALLAATPGAAAANGSANDVAGMLALENPDAALEWAATLETASQKREASHLVLRTWAEENPQAALERARAFTDAADQKAAVSAVLERWAGNDPDAALTWAATAAVEEKSLVQIQSTLAKSSTDPAESSILISEMIAQQGAAIPSQLENAAIRVASSWAQQDVAAASIWAAGLPQGKVQEHAVQLVAQSWANSDPMAASEWVTQLPAGRSRDLAAQSISSSVSYTDPESSLAWASSIQDTTLRDDAIRDTIRSWRRQDKKAAQAALLQAPLTESMRASMLQELAAQQE